MQSACLVLFLALFLFTIWPYSARPARQWPHWIPVNVDAETGQATMEADGAVPPELASGKEVSLRDETAQPDANHLGDFVVTNVSGRQVILRPRSSLTDGQLDSLSLSVGPWTVLEQPPGKWPSHYADELDRKEKIAAELFLAMDPLVSISTAIAAKAWVWSLAIAGVTLLVALAIPRGFCGYVCPLGTTIDLFDWAVSRRLSRFRVNAAGWWVRLKYMLLGATLVAALFGVLLSGFVAAIPVITRAAAFVLTPLAIGWTRDWHQIPPIGTQHLLSLTLFVAILGLGLLQPRFWCKYACPSGALFSLGNLFRVSERKVEASCIHCGHCINVCPFDAIKADFTTRTLDCTFCQTCGGVCPTHSIRFVDRWAASDWKDAGDPAREAIAATAAFSRGHSRAVAGAVAGAAATIATEPRASADKPIVRPPGSVPEPQFLQLCIRCGECYQACPNSVLQPLGLERGLNSLWTPFVAADWSGCEPSCCNCGHVCPTGAIRALPLEEKRVAHMGLAVVDPTTCLPFVGKDACQLCVDECQRAGYDAIEFLRVGTQFAADGQPIEDTGLLAPVVRADRCVGCGLCQTRCYKINVHGQSRLHRSAIEVQAGAGKEDRIATGSYVALRTEEQRKQPGARQGSTAESDQYLPGFLSKPEK